MLLSSFYSSLSGLRANSTALNVVGNNLANVNTNGYKRARANFAQIMSSQADGLSGARNPIQVGLGTKNTEIVSRFDQGSIQTTGVKTHLAIQGEGFFQVSKNGRPAYTRSGNFSFDSEGRLLAANGARVQGWQGTRPDGTVDVSGGVGDIQIDFGVNAAPKTTELVRFIANLSAEAATGDAYQTAIEVFDSKGVAHQLTLELTKNAAPGRWDYQFAFADGDVSTTAPNQGDGFIEFGPDGRLATLDGTAITDPLAANRVIGLENLNSGAADMLVTWDLIELAADPADNAGFITNFGTTFNAGTLFQDGYGSGVLQDLDFDQAGTMIGFFDNGSTLELARVALAIFNNNLGLKQTDGGFYLTTAASGPASIDPDGGRGAVLSSSLESSNVDIAEEFTDLIIHQRGYQSNSRTITTTDQLLQEAINLKN